MTRLPFLLPLALLACTTSEKDTAEDPSGDTAEETVGDTAEETQPDPFSISEGTYVISEPVYVDDGCGLDDGEEDDSDDEAATLIIASTGVASYSATMNEMMVYTCSLDDQTLTCDDLIDNEESTEEWNATQITSVALNMVFTSETAFDGTAGMTYSCEGADCADLEALGFSTCTTTFAITGTLQE